MTVWLEVVALLCLTAPAAEANVTLRGRLDNCRARFDRGEGRVAFLGGSITEMNGYRPMVMDLLRRKFPQTRFTFIDAGIASTCSTTGAFRLESDVLRHGPVDLLFVEFAVNDDQDAHHARRECIRGMEGILRRLRLHNPAADAVVTYFVNPEMLAQIQAGQEPLSMAAHEAAAERYGVSSIHLAREVAQRIRRGQLTWEQFGGTHPAPAGNAIATGMIEQLLARAWQQPLEPGAKARPHALPEPLDAMSYFQGRFVSPEKARSADWRWETPNWKSLRGGSRSRFENRPLLVADKSGAATTFDFQGTAIGLYLLAGPDAGEVEVQIDDGPAGRVNLLHAYSKDLHYPRTVMLATDLPPGNHRLSLRLVSPAGTAVRMLELAVNGPTPP